jgi:hypothetical protein
MKIGVKPRRMPQANLPAHAQEGELIITQDTHRLYVGEGADSPLASVSLADDVIEVNGVPYTGVVRGATGATGPGPIPTLTFTVTAVLGD